MRELEEKRINKEMANIRKKFKGCVKVFSIVYQLLRPFCRRQFGRIPEEEVNMQRSYRTEY